MITRVLLLVAVTAATPAAASDFGVTSPDFRPGATVATAQVYRGSGCQGGNRSPALGWHGAPEGTRGYAITLFDPDANAGRGWWHWLVTGIPAEITSLHAGGPLPAGATALHNDFGEAGYGGPCPPPGDTPHHYVLTVYALNTDSLPLDASSDAGHARQVIEQHALAEASITARYGR